MEIRDWGPEKIYDLLGGIQNNQVSCLHSLFLLLFVPWQRTTRVVKGTGVQRGHGNVSTFKCSNGGPPCLFEQSSCHFGKKVGQEILSALSGAVAEGLKKVSGDTSSLSPSVADNPESVLKELARCLRRTHSGISALNNIVVNSLYTGILLCSLEQNRKVLFSRNSQVEGGRQSRFPPCVRQKAT